MTQAGPTPGDMVQRLLDATNAHDLEALVGCFSPGYVNETPAHPARGFTGQQQVRRNWEQIFKFVPDLHATVVSRAVDGDRVWSEWEMAGTKPDGSPHLMRGVNIFTVADGVASAARFYLEPVDLAATGVDEAVGAIAKSRS